MAFNNMGEDNVAVMESSSSCAETDDKALDMRYAIGKSREQLVARSFCPTCSPWV